MSYKVKLVAIAKDEATYIPEWVHHHLFVGFDEIEIFINRTTDSSQAVLTSICEKYPNVSWRTADWVDQCPPEASKHIQFITYSQAMYQCQEAEDFTHIFFLDIDEFLILDKLSSSIHQIIERFPQGVPIAFEWLNDCTPTAAAFSRLPRTLTGNLSPLVKTLLPVDIQIKEFRHHLPVFKNNVETLLVDKTKFVSQEKVKQALDKSVNFLKSSFIYHRAHRSQYEYISLLYRGRPGDSFAYKSNRRGYPKITANTASVALDKTAYNDYQSSYEKFIVDTNIVGLADESQAFVRQRYDLSIANIPQHLALDYSLMLRLFKGVSDPQVLAAFKQHRENLVKSEPTNVDLLIRLALDAQPQDLDEAIALITLAKAIRPKGPLINKKLTQFLSMKQQA
ncbi:glycosyltransferase family 2 protein [Shewanella sp. 6_MG-2023]|uniref:glycosyltransferase family 2 protein n=1 Tax=Shewanella sp. 6_MG-2023 TaxID=3062660 RepID=UPI0026E2234A|nr:glycosyltransferase family 2 protein [Shewanella sp. 6_MG-2023]MDO6617649.1 glycosyltransferase family 2 protein [Shewanella sp. 6_MG-2023]